LSLQEHSASPAPIPERRRIPALERPRIGALDAARALGVLAMVFGHTLDALLAPAVRETPLAVAYWKARGLTAPLFLMVSGWAVTVAISRGRATGPAILRGRLPRVALLLGIGYALRWPGWGLERLAAGDPSVWSHLLAFDALHTIALALLATAAVLALPWTRREQGLALAALLVLAWSLGLRGPAPLPPAPASVPHAPALLALWQADGGTSPFPLFPWAAYFFAGAILALAAPGGAPRAGPLAAVGAALVAATCWTGVGTMPPANPLLIAFRIGVILLVVAALTHVPAGAAGRVAPLGRASLAIYAIHVPLVYGWSTLDGLAQRVGPTRGAGAALGIAACVLVASVGIHRVVGAARWLVATGAARVRAAAAGAGATDLE
jgi:acyltransferase